MKILVSENQFKFLVNLITEDDDRVKENVMFVGDSHSAGKGWTWNYLLTKDHPEWNVTHVVQGGKRTDWMLQNMTSELQKKKYDLVFIYGGTNDVMSPIKNEVPISNIQKMVDEVNKQGGKAIVVLGFDQEGLFDATKVKPTIYCDKKCFAEYKPKRVDYQKRLGESIRNAIIVPKLDADTSWTTDGIHAIASKHSTLKKHVGDYIKDVEKSNKTSTTTNNKDEKKEKFKKFFERYFEFLKTNEVVDQNSSDKKIRMIQVILFIVTKDNSIEINGILDGNTKVAINKFQKNNGLTESGIFDLKTQDKLTQKIFKTYPGRQIEDIKKGSGGSEENTSLAITNPGVKVRNLPSNLEEQFKNIPGVDFNKFKSDVESIGIPVKYAIRQLFVESAFLPDVINCKRVSTAGARGLAQFMPGTWPTYGKGGDPCKVQDALPAYVKFMSYLVKRFPGRLDLAFAGYNSGPNLKAYSETLKNKTPFTDLKGKIPSEAYAYASSILQP
jgi:peptidoglycan hydrolase-like protein with peptidoglycan-binding domain